MTVTELEIQYRPMPEEQMEAWREAMRIIAVLLAEYLSMTSE